MAFRFGRNPLVSTVHSPTRVRKSSTRVPTTTRPNFIIPPTRVQQDGAQGERRHASVLRHLGSRAHQGGGQKLGQGSHDGGRQRLRLRPGGRTARHRCWGRRGQPAGRLAVQRSVPSAPTDPGRAPAGAAAQTVRGRERGAGRSELDGRGPAGGLGDGQRHVAAAGGGRPAQLRHQGAPSRGALQRLTRRLPNDHLHQIGLLLSKATSPFD
ncbi:uncharacterized protein LOC133395172 [Phycodurus eques]|uniref:uncharacterized protein LOC133395172 n=1 Tax=Phycodurus eques TaxID=693459 RepID=UPI002ACEAC93|nr:uncharacterized protein LOC133395172 [Phycodurus eques]